MKAERATPGRVVFVGAGPGQADLITLRGAQRLGEAEVVLFDSLADPALRELAPKARWIDVGKRGFRGVPHGSSEPGAENTGQDTINALLVKHAQSGARVVRLKGGDPSVFGRLEEELEALAAAGIESEVVPGVSAALAAAAATQRPLTRRGSGRSVALTTAMTHDRGLQVGRNADTGSSTWPESSSAPWRVASWPPGGRGRAGVGGFALAGRTSWPATTASPPSARPRCCMPADPPWSWSERAPVKSAIRPAPRRRPGPVRAWPEPLQHDPRRPRILHPLQVHRLRRRLPGRLLP
jgi:siroheme synthase